MKYELNEELRKELYDTLKEVYEGCQGISGPRIPLEELLSIFKEPIPEQPLWRQEPFTDTDRDMLMGMMMEEVGDSVRDYAIEALDNITDITELVGYVDDDPQATAELLADFLTSYHPQPSEFMYRMGLVSRGNEVTDLGIKYIKEYK
jgi:hypothetical protein